MCAGLEFGRMKKITHALRRAVGLFLFAPFLLLWPIAVTSTVCDDLMKSLNNARLRQLSQPGSHERIFALETGALS